MSIEKVESHVMAQAETEAKKIVEEARREGQALLAKRRAEAERDVRDAVREAEARGARETARQLGRARHDGRLEVLEAKNAVLDEVFRKVQEAIQSMPDEQYLNLLASWLKDLAAETGGTLRASARDASRFPGNFLEKVNAGRPESGRFASIVADPAVTGGFIIEGADFTVDLTIERKLHELRESLSGELAKELFGT